MSGSERSDRAHGGAGRLAAWGQRALQVWFFVGLACCLYIFGVVIGVLSIPIGIVLITFLIVFCLRGIVNGLHRVGVPRIVGTTIAYAAMFAVLGLLTMVITSPFLGVGDQFVSLFDSLPSYFSQAQATTADFIEQLRRDHPDIVENPYVLGLINDAAARLSAFAEEILRTGLTNLVDLGTVTFNFLVAAGFALVVAFWVLISLPEMGKECYRLAGPNRREDARFLYVTLTRVMGGYVRGTLIQCVIIAVGCGIAFALMGVPNSAAFAIIAGVLNLIPVVGPWLGGAAAGCAALSQGPVLSISVVVVTIVIQQFVYTFVSPKLMADSVDVHPALVIIAMMAGLAIGGAVSGVMGGLVGMLFSIPFAAVAKAVFVYYFEKRTGRHLVAVDGVLFKGVPTEGDDPDPTLDATSPHPEALLWKKRLDSRRSLCPKHLRPSSSREDRSDDGR